MGGRSGGSNGGQGKNVGSQGGGTNRRGRRGGKNGNRNNEETGAIASNVIASGPLVEPITDWDLGIDTDFLNEFANTEITAPSDLSISSKNEDAIMTEPIIAPVEAIEEIATA